MGVATRSDRRRAAAEEKHALKARVCWRCGFASVKEVPNSYLVIGRDSEGNVGWTHASPTVCAGYVLAITNQARETVRGAAADLFRILTLRTAEKLQTFLRFWKEDRVDNVGGTSQRDPLKTRREMFP